MNDNPAIVFPDAADTDPFKDDNADNDTEYKLRSPFHYTTLSGIGITVPQGFETDGVSAPQVSWSLIGLPPDGYYRDAGIVHDYLYSVKGAVPTVIPPFTRQQCDDILLEILTRLDVPWIKRKAAYLAVRLFGGSHWQP